MHTEVFNNIDTLIEMAGASARNMDELNAEVITLKRQIRNKTNEIEDFKSMLTDARYFNASNELVDKNIEISLKNKIARLNRKIKDITINGENLSSNEEALHEEIKNLKKKLNKNEKYVEVLEVKNGLTNNEYYKKMLDTEKNNVKELNSILDNKNSDYENILKELELNNQAKIELEEKLTKEEERLNDILDSLNNPNQYIDEELKRSDEEKLEALEKELANYQRRELELLTDASVIGADAKELIATNDAQNAILKVKELVTIVKSQPFMDINNPAILDEELEKKEALRIELAGLIDSKSYDGVNSDTIKERIEFLNKEIEANNEVVAKLKNEINDIDECITNVLGNKINNLETEIINGEKVIQDYKDLLKNKDNDLKTKTNLEQAVVKKQKEVQVLDNILAAYKDTLVSKVNDTNKLNERITETQEINSRYLKELDGLQKIVLINFQTKDLVEEEKDKEDLRKLNEEIKQIKLRKQYEKTPSQIYDEIEIALAGIKPAEHKENTEDLTVVDNLNTEDVIENKEAIDVNSIPQLEIENEIPIEPLDENLEIKEENNKNEESINLDAKIDEVIEEVSLEDNDKSRIKVIDMIPVETVKKGGGKA